MSILTELRNGEISVNTSPWTPPNYNEGTNLDINRVGNFGMKQPN